MSETNKTHDQENHFCVICYTQFKCSGQYCDFNEVFHSHPSCMKGKTVIPKDCAVCDFCNKGVTDSKFVALENAIWFQGALACGDCVENYNLLSDKDYEIVLRISKGDSVANTELAYPIVMSFGGSF